MKVTPKLIVITGLPATGKTWLANELSLALSVPLFTKDELKIEILKHLGKKDRLWDRQVGIVAMGLQMKLAKTVLSNAYPVILESNFSEEFDGSSLRNLIENTSSECLQIVCGAEGNALIQRFSGREKSAERSSFYFSTNLEEFIPKLQKGFEAPLNLPGQVILVDTTDLSKVDLEAIVRSTKEFMSRKKPSVFHHGQRIAEGILVANNFWTRFSGYMLRREPHVSAILFEPSGAIQTTFMCFSLDIVFLTSFNRVVKIRRDLRPWKFACSPSEASKLLELPAGSLPSIVKVGDFLDFRK